MENNIQIFDSVTSQEIKYERMSSPIGISGCNSQYTVVINLNSDEDVILKGFHSTTKNLVNQCQKKDNPIVEFVEKPNEELIKEFINKYAQFAEDKNSDVMRNVVDSTDEKIHNWAKQGILRFSIIYSKDYPDCKIYHAHQINSDAKIVRLMCSISCFRNTDSYYKNMIGRLNRFLHYKDFLKFKELGYKVYDLGGVTLGDAPEENERVAKFKFTLSNKIKKYYYADLISDCNVTCKKRIALKYNNQEEYDIALNIANQLSDKYVFFLEQGNVDTDKYNYVHDLIRNELNLLYYLYNPEEFYYQKNRVDSIKIGTFDDMKKMSETKDALCEILNSYDVVVCDNEKDAIISIACGCFVITSKNSEVMQSIIRNKSNGIIIDFDITLDDALAYCSKRLKDIRNNAYKNSKEIMDEYSYFSASEVINEFYISELECIRRQKEIVKFFEIRKDNSRITLKILGLKIRFKVRERLAAVERERERERERGIVPLLRFVYN